jgi:DNA-binding transcriptional LysR family regulator
MFRWDDLGVLVAACRHGTLAAAGAALGVDPSTVSRRLAALEDAVGGKLFARTPEGLSPTTLALRLLPHAEAAEAAVNAASAEAAGATVAAEGVVRLAVADALGVYGIAPRAAELRRLHPGVRLDILASTAVVDLSRREADIAIRFVRPDRGDLVFKKVLSAGRYAAFCSREYAEAHPDLSIDAVDWITWSETRAHLPEARLYRELIGREPALTSDNLVVQIEAVRAGAGVLLMPAGWGEVTAGAVQLPTLPPIALDFSTYLVTHRALRRVPRVDAVWRWLEDLLAQIGDLTRASE